MKFVKSRIKKWRLSNFFKNHNAAFVYHHIGEENELGIHNVSHKVFEKQLIYLKKYFDFVQIDDLFNSPSRTNIASITFDDGAASFISTALPILQAHNIPTTLFLNSSLLQGKPFWRDMVISLIRNRNVEDFILYSGLDKLSVDTFYQDSKDPVKVETSVLINYLNEFFLKFPDLLEKRNLATLDQLKSINSDLFKVGNHTSNHFILSSFNFQTQLNEITSNKLFLESNFDKNKISNVLAIPFGNSISYNGNTIEAAKKANYFRILSTESSSYYNLNNMPLSKRKNVSIFNRFMPKEKTFQ